MKIYKKCENCDSALDQSNYPCWKCGGSGYTETEIPVEQALEALKTASEYLCVGCSDRNTGRDCVNNPCRAFTDVRQAIKALEGVK